MKKFHYFLLATALWCSACNSNQRQQEDFDTITLQDVAQKKAKQAIDSALKATDSIKRANPDTLQLLANEILKVLQDKNYLAFSRYFHPNKGVIFSPYGFIDTEKSKKLLANDFVESIEKNWTLTWGVFDGTGEPMQLKVVPYIQKFVYNANYLKAEKVATDEQLGKGNSPNNIAKIFPDAHFVEYYFSGFDKQYNGMDWSSLRLVFEKLDGKMYLVAIVHDQWTS